MENYDLMDEDKLLSSKELSDLALTSTTTIYRWVRTKKIIPTETINGRHFFSRNEFSYLKEPPPEKVKIPPKKKKPPEKKEIKIYPTKFWSELVECNSNKLWLPTKSTILESTQILKKTLPETKFVNLPKTSWCSIVKKENPTKSLLSLSYQDFSFIKSFPLEEEENEKDYKTISFRIKFWTEKEELEKGKDELRKIKCERKQMVKTTFEQYVWYYNATLEFLLFHEGGKFKETKHSRISIENLIRDCEVIETEDETFILRLDEKKVLASKLRKKKTLVPGEKKKVDRRPLPVPPLWETNVHSRTVRGAIQKFTMALNAAISNKKNGNIKTFKMKPLVSKKTNCIHFDDGNYPDFFRKKIEGVYWYRNLRGKKKLLYSEFRKLFPTKGMEVFRDRVKNKYYLRAPADMDWFPEDDRRKELNVTLSGKTIALDPGVRKFQVGYDPEGEILMMGKGANKDLQIGMQKIDNVKSGKKKYQNIRKRKLWNKEKDKVSDMHWKISDYLVKHYDTILLPTFKTSTMVLKNGILQKKTRREINMLSFYKFKMKLIYQCKKYGKKLLIVDESYTSKTCSNCGSIKDIKYSEVYECDNCDITLDRDVNGSRNIFLRNLEKIL